MVTPVPDWSVYSDPQLEAAIGHLWHACEKKKLLYQQMGLALRLLNLRRFPLPDGETHCADPVTPATHPEPVLDVAELLRQVQVHSLWIHTQGRQGAPFRISEWVLHPDVHFAYLWLVRIQGEHADVRQKNFADANMMGAVMRHAQAEGACFDRVQGMGAQCAHWVAPRSRALYANWAYADFQKAQMQEAVWTGANLQGANLQGADLTGADLRGACLVGAHLEQAILHGIQWEGADASGAFFAGASLDPALDPHQVTVYHAHDLQQIQIPTTAESQEG